MTKMIIPPFSGEPAGNVSSSLKALFHKKKRKKGCVLPFASCYAVQKEIYAVLKVPYILGGLLNEMKAIDWEYKINQL